MGNEQDSVQLRVNWRPTFTSWRKRSNSSLVFFFSVQFFFNLSNIKKGFPQQRQQLWGHLCRFGPGRWLDEPAVYHIQSKPSRPVSSSSISSLSSLAFKSSLQHSLPAFITSYEEADWFWNTKTDWKRFQLEIGLLRFLFRYLANCPAMFGHRWLRTFATLWLRRKLRHPPKYHNNSLFFISYLGFACCANIGWLGLSADDHSSGTVLHCHPCLTPEPKIYE